jgi:hypothetical protein
MDKKVLRYCIGGIWYEKASAVLRKRGGDDPSISGRVWGQGLYFEARILSLIGA